LSCWRVLHTVTGESRENADQVFDALQRSADAMVALRGFVQRERSDLDETESSSSDSNSDSESSRESDSDGDGGIVEYHPEALHGSRWVVGGGTPPQFQVSVQWQCMTKLSRGRVYGPGGYSHISLFD